MKNIDFIFDENDYRHLKKEYDKNLAIDANIAYDLNRLTLTLESNNFQMPIMLQNDILNTLSQALDILNILHPGVKGHPQHLNNNIFEFINVLSQISIKLNSHSIKSAYQILYLKTNDLLLDCINKISKHFSNKKLKIFRFI